MPTIKLRRGTQAAILASSDMHIGEVGFATDEKSLFVYDGITKHMVGKATVSPLLYRPQAGVNGRFFYADDTTELFLDTGSAWVQVNASSVPTTLSGIGGIVTEELGGIWYVDGTDLLSKFGGKFSLRGTGEFSSVSGYTISHNINTTEHHIAVTLAGTEGFNEENIASVGDIYIQVGLNTDIVYHTGGPNADGLTFFWELSYNDPNVLPNYVENSVRGVSLFSLGGTELNHGLGTLNHFTSVIPASSSSFDEYDIASIGSVYIQIGLATDTVFCTGGAGAVGKSFYWESTASGFSNEVTFADLTTLSGNLVNLIPSVTISGNLMGTGLFDYSGYSIEHSLGTKNHYVCITPAGEDDYNEELIASIGHVYVKKGDNTDVVYHTGGPIVNGLTFDWEVIQHGLRMIDAL